MNFGGRANLCVHFFVIVSVATVSATTLTAKPLFRSDENLCYVRLRDCASQWQRHTKVFEFLHLTLAYLGKRKKKKQPSWNKWCNVVKQCVIHESIHCQSQPRENTTCSQSHLFLLCKICLHSVYFCLFSVCFSVLFLLFVSLSLPLCHSRSASLCCWCEFFITILVYTQKNFRPLCMMAIQGTPEAFSMIVVVKRNARLCKACFQCKNDTDPSVGDRKTSCTLYKILHW